MANWKKEMANWEEDWEEEIKTWEEKAKELQTFFDNCPQADFQTMKKIYEELKNFFSKASGIEREDEQYFSYLRQTYLFRIRKKESSQ